MTTKKKNHCDSSISAMVTVLWTFLAQRPRRSSSALSTSNCLSRLTDRGISKLGEPSRPTPSRTWSVERNHDLRREEAVVAGPALRGIGDPVPQEVLCPDRHAGQAEGRAREVGIDDGQPVRDHRSAADRAEERGVVLDDLAEVRTGLPHLAKVVAQPTQVVDDVGGVTEETHVELAVGRAGDRAVDPVVESVQRVDLVRRDEEVQHARNGSHEHEADEHERRRRARRR